MNDRIGLAEARPAADDRPRHRTIARTWRAAILLLIAGALAVPFLVAELPPVADYPNHLARAFLLAFGQDDPVLAAMYAPHWALIPNLALDLVLPPLLHLLPLHVAGRLFLYATLVLPLIGVTAYHRALVRRRAWWPAAAALIAFNGGFLLGLMNFQLAIAAALLSAAAWQRWRETRPGLAVPATCLGAVIVYFCHLSGLVMLAALIGAAELDVFIDWFNRKPTTSLRRIIIRWGLATLPFLLPVALYPLSPTAGVVAPTVFLPLVAKLAFAVAPMMNYDPDIDTTSIILVLLAAGLGLARGWLVMPRHTVIGLIALVSLFLVAPFQVKSGAFVDFRLIIMAAFLLFAGTSETTTMPRAAAGAFCVGFILLFGLRTALVADAWHNEQTDVAQVRATVAPVPPGSRVLVTTVEITDAPAWFAGAPRGRTIDRFLPTNLHLPVISLIQHRAFAQMLFTDPAQQPITVRPRYAASASFQAAYGTPSIYLLAQPALAPIPALKFPYLIDWREKYDYVLVVNAGGMADASEFLPERLELVSITGVAALFRVRK